MTTMTACSEKIIILIRCNKSGHGDCLNWYALREGGGDYIED